MITTQRTDWPASTSPGRRLGRVGRAEAAWKAGREKREREGPAPEGRGAGGPSLSSGLVGARSCNAFTIIELLVVIAIVALLLGVLLPSLGGAREAGRSGVCLSNERQLTAAILLYAADHADHAPPGAADFRANLSRWHGARERTNEPFDPRRGPLTPYLGGEASRAVRECPTFAGVLARLAGAGLGFERAAGGYGYNNAYVGVELAPAGGGAYRVRDDRAGAALALFEQPDATVVFADAAFPDRRAPDLLIEYSFAEPRFHVQYPSSRMDPSIHFRHASAGAAVALLDGHAKSEKLTHTWSSGLYYPPSEEVAIGWFGEDDCNGLFDFAVGGR